MNNNYTQTSKQITEAKTNIQKRCDTEKREKDYRQSDEYKRIEQIQKREIKNSNKRKQIKQNVNVSR